MCQPSHQCKCVLELCTCSEYFNISEEQRNNDSTSRSPHTCYWPTESVILAGHLYALHSAFNSGLPWADVLHCPSKLMTTYYINEGASVRPMICSDKFGNRKVEQFRTIPRNYMKTLITWTYGKHSDCCFKNTENVFYVYFYERIYLHKDYVISMLAWIRFLQTDVCLQIIKAKHATHYCALSCIKRIITNSSPLSVMVNFHSSLRFVYSTNESYFSTLNNI